MKHTNEGTTRRYMKTMKAHLLGMTDREFDIIAPAITGLVNELTDFRRDELTKWKLRKIEEVSLLANGR